MTRTLLVLRHAEAEPGHDVEDLDRSLTERGISDARRAAAAVRPLPDLVLCSPALRARQTWQEVRAGLGQVPEVRIEQGIYAAGPEAVLQLVRETPEEVASLLVVGHNPAVHQLVADLSDGQAPRAYPPGSLAELTVALDWASLLPGGATLTRHWIP
jgi:phosphohistidine phosphatase